MKVVTEDWLPGVLNSVPQEEALYTLGNGLRGYKTGYFSSDDEAWRVLSEQFNQSFPSRGGRTVHMNKTIGRGLTAGGNETEEDRRIREQIQASLVEDGKAADSED